MEGYYGAMEFRMVTYNIHKGIGGRDRRYRLERIVEALEHLHADVVLLQEVDDGVPRSHFHCQVRMLAESLKFPHHAFQRNVRLKRGYYGNALLSKYPLSDVSSCDLSVRFKKRRQALMARCRLPVAGHSRSLLLSNVHLGLAGPERVYQLRKLLKDVLICHAKSHTPIVIGGDFNDLWASLGRRVMEPAGFLPVCKKIRTFPAAIALRPLDNFFYRGPLKVHQAFASHTKVAREASDHLPLVADLELGE